MQNKLVAGFLRFGCQILNGYRVVNNCAEANFLYLPLPGYGTSKPCVMLVGILIELRPL